MTLSRAFARIFWAVAIFLIVIAVIFACITIFQLSGSLTVSGTISGFDVVQNAIPYTEEDSGLQYYPLLEYRGRSGELTQFVSPQPVSPERLPEGTELELLLLGNGQVRINSFTGIWGRSLVFLGTSVLFLIFGFGALRSFDSKKY